MTHPLTETLDSAIGHNLGSDICLFVGNTTERPQTPAKPFDAEQDLLPTLELITKLLQNDSRKITVILPVDLNTWRTMTPEEELIFLESIDQTSPEGNVRILRTELLQSFPTPQNAIDHIHSPERVMVLDTEKNRMIQELLPALRAGHAIEIGGVSIQNSLNMAEHMARAIRLDERRLIPVHEIERSYAMPWQNTRRNKKKKNR